MNLSPQQKQKLISYYPELRKWFEDRDRHEELKKMASEAPKLPPEVLSKIKAVKGEKGDKGDQGDPYKLSQEDINLILSKATPKKGVDYYEGRDGKDGKHGRNGMDGKEGKRGPRGEMGLRGPAGRDGSSDTPLAIANKLNSLNGVVDVKVIKGAARESDVKKSLDGMAKIDGRIKAIDLRWHGGGLSKVSTDSTLSGSGTPSSPLTVTVSGTLALLTATGTIDNSNVTFTFTKLPLMIFINGTAYVQNSGWTWNGGTLTATLSAPVGTGGKIWGI